LKPISIEKCHCGRIKAGEHWVSPLDFIRKIIQLRNEEKIENVELINCTCPECTCALERAESASYQEHKEAQVRKQS
jgi:hypothetical protein